MSDFKSRLLIEKSELDEKINKLSSFIESDNFTTIDTFQQALLYKQLSIMQDYSKILSDRIHFL